MQRRLALRHYANTVDGPLLRVDVEADAGLCEDALGMGLCDALRREGPLLDGLDNSGAAPFPARGTRDFRLTWCEVEPPDDPIEPIGRLALGGDSVTGTRFRHGSHVFAGDAKPRF